MPRLDRYPTKPHFDRYAPPRARITPALRRALDDFERPHLAAWQPPQPDGGPLVEVLTDDDDAVRAWRARGGK